VDRGRQANLREAVTNRVITDRVITDRVITVIVITDRVITDIEAHLREAVALLGDEQEVRGRLHVRGHISDASPVRTESAMAKPVLSAVCIGFDHCFGGEGGGEAPRVAVSAKPRVCDSRMSDDHMSDDHISDDHMSDDPT
jgi:hypothetical protein